MSCHEPVSDVRDEPGATLTNNALSEDRRYLAERPRLMLTMLDLMQRFAQEEDIGSPPSDPREVVRHAP